MKTPDAHPDWMRHVRPESLRSVFDHLPGVMFFAKNLAGRFTMANLAFAQRCGVPDEASLLGKSDEDIFPPELAAAFKKKDLQICQTGQPLPRIIELFPNADGEHVWYETTKVPLFDEAGRAAMVDVSAKAETNRTATARGRVVMHPDTLARAREIAGRVTEALGGRGIFGVELFVRGDEVISNLTKSRNAIANKRY